MILRNNWLPENCYEGIEMLGVSLRVFVDEFEEVELNRKLEKLFLVNFKQFFISKLVQRDLQGLICFAKSFNRVARKSTGQNDPTAYHQDPKFSIQNSTASNA